MEQIAEFLGWSTLINLIFLVISFLCLTAFRQPILRLHKAMFGLSDDELLTTYLGFLANYKILIIVFNLVPWIALRIVL